MARAPYIQHQPEKAGVYDIARAQDQLRSFRSRLYQLSPILDGRLIEDEALTAHTANDIEHKLGRKLRGYFVVKDNTPPSSARAYRNSALSITDNSNTKIELDAASYDDNSDFDITTNYRFDAPVDGLYEFIGNVAYSLMSDGDDVYVFVTKNGTAVTRGTRQAMGVGTKPTYHQVADMVRLEKDDYLELWTYYDGVSATESLTIGDSRNFLAVKLVNQLTDGQDDVGLDQTKYLRLYSTCARTVTLWVF